MAKEEKKVSEMNDEERLAYHKAEAQKIQSKNRWMGKGGIWSTFRNIGKDIYNDKDLDTATKKEKLQEQINAFVEERLS